MGLVEEKIEKIKSLIQKGITVKMRRADGAKQIDNISTKNGVVIIEFVDNELIFLTQEQFLNRDVITDKLKNTGFDEKEVDNMIQVMKEYIQNKWNVYYKDKKVVSINKKGDWVVIETEDGTIYTQKGKDFLESYKSARVK